MVKFTERNTPVFMWHGLQAMNKTVQVESVSKTVWMLDGRKCWYCTPVGDVNAHLPSWLSWYKFSISVASFLLQVSTSMHFSYLCNIFRCRNEQSAAKLMHIKQNVHIHQKHSTRQKNIQTYNHNHTGQTPRY